MLSTPATRRGRWISPGCVAPRRQAASIVRPAGGRGVLLQALVEVEKVEQVADRW